MPEKSVSVYQLIDSLQELEGNIDRFMKEIDGVSLLMPEEVSGYWVEVLGKVRDKGLKELMIFENVVKGKAGRLGEVIRLVKPYAVSLPDPGLIAELRKSLTDLSTKFGVMIRNPFPNFQVLRKVGVEFVIMPTALIKGRVVKEAKASGLDLIAYLVNDPATYMKVRSSGVSGVITRNPGVIREAEKIRY